MTIGKHFVAVLIMWLLLRVALLYIAIVLKDSFVTDGMSYCGGTHSLISTHRPNMICFEINSTLRAEGTTTWTWLSYAIPCQFSTQAHPGRASFRLAPSLERLQRVSLSPATLKRLSFAVTAQLVQFPQRDEPDVVCSQSFLSILGQQVFWNMLQVRLLSCRS